MTLTQPLHIHVTALLAHNERALTLWEEYVQVRNDSLPHEAPELFAAAIETLLGEDSDDVAMRHDIDPSQVRALSETIRVALDLSPFDPRYASSSPRVNPLMQQLAGLLFEVCERSHDPLDGTLELPQIATTWTLLTMELPGERGRDTLVSLVDNHTKFVLDQRLIDASELTVKIAVDVLVSVLHKSGIRPDDVMIQSAGIAHELGERLERIKIAWSVTDGAHLGELSAMFAARFSEPETLHTYFEQAPDRLPQCVDALHAHTTRFWELRPWERLGNDVMLDISSSDRSWLVSVLDERGGRLGFTLFDASEEESEEVGSQQILALVDCAQIDRATLAALASLGFSPAGEDYFAMLITDHASPPNEDDFLIAAALCRALNTYVESQLDETTINDPIFGALHIKLAD